MNIYETYVKEICSKCKNKNKDCELRKRIDNTMKCREYERSKVK